MIHYRSFIHANPAAARIAVAVALGGLLVGVALWHSHNATPVATTIETATTNISIQSARKHITVTDSNQNGIPDWQEVLLDDNILYLGEATTTEYVPPDVPTSDFPVRFQEDIMTLEIYGVYDETKDDLVAAAKQELEEIAKAPTYTEEDLVNIVTVNNAAALRAYGNLVAGTIFHYQTDDENEYDVFARMTADQNPKHLEKLKVIETQYDNIINALLELEVPEQYVFEHLAVVNSLSELRQNVIGMQWYFEDPIYTITRYHRLYEHVLGMNAAIAALYDGLTIDDNITFADNETLPVLVELLQ